ncbi:glycosyltransferase [Allobaculum sp. Allo2]|nr:glycosyltransferase [Allobaculum sp. Allo2]UNT93757.1 glycosyltransferase [Allobaculum sp. Allo2]
MNEKIAVVIPVYNVEKYISKCIESVCTQSYPNLEIILVDDGSTDSSGEICDAYQKKMIESEFFILLIEACPQPGIMVFSSQNLTG